ncbi:hypothetical protein SDC9_184610 [bioreactor metagenome]|uniref:Uncharacterized protein n=1 Tax=bioreactor metagenome TaxID=1076179 RepID=A0A645HLW8_9ZZZZ
MVLQRWYGQLFLLNRLPIEPWIPTHYLLFQENGCSEIEYETQSNQHRASLLKFHSAMDIFQKIPDLAKGCARKLQFSLPVLFFLSFQATMQNDNPELK